LKKGSLFLKVGKSDGQIYNSSVAYYLSILCAKYYTNQSTYVDNTVKLPGGVFLTYYLTCTEQRLRSVSSALLNAQLCIVPYHQQPFFPAGRTWNTLPECQSMSRRLGH